MKTYQKPVCAVMQVVQSVNIAVDPWASFADSLDELGGAITSYTFASGIEIQFVRGDI